MRKFIFGIIVTLAVLFSGCGESENKESAEVRKAKEIMAKNVIEEEKKREEQKELRKNGQGTHLLNAK